MKSWTAFKADRYFQTLSITLREKPILVSTMSVKNTSLENLLQIGQKFFLTPIPICLVSIERCGACGAALDGSKLTLLQVERPVLHNSIVNSDIR